MSAPTSRLGEDLTELATATRAELKDHWHTSFGSDAPTWLSTDLLRRALAHQRQLVALGPGTPAIVRHLRSHRANQRDTRRSGRPAVGTRLVREWGGKAHVIDVVPAGFQWSGQTYRSLSEVARAITGARWSGPRFFGLATAPTAPGSP
jgi:hypothetical protein